jgi:hypothetical protein
VRRKLRNPRLLSSLPNDSENSLIAHRPKDYSIPLGVETGSVLYVGTFGRLQVVPTLSLPMLGLLAVAVAAASLLLLRKR